MYRYSYINHLEFITNSTKKRKERNLQVAENKLMQTDFRQGPELQCLSMLIACIHQLFTVTLWAGWGWGRSMEVVWTPLFRANLASALLCAFWETLVHCNQMRLFHLLMMSALRFSNQMSCLISRTSSLTNCLTTVNNNPPFPSSPSLSTWGLCAPSFALLLLLLLPLFALVLGQLQQVLGDLVVGFTALQWGVGRWQGERIEALPFVLGPLGLQLRLGGGRRGRGELKRVQLQRTGAASELELIWCCGGRALQGK